MLGRRSLDVEAVVRATYVRGLSTQDVSDLFAETFGPHRLSKSTVRRVTPRLLPASLKRLVQQVFLAPSDEVAVKRGRALIARFRDRYPAAMECLERDRIPSRA